MRWVWQPLCASERPWYILTVLNTRNIESGIRCTPPTPSLLNLGIFFKKGGNNVVWLCDEVTCKTCMLSSYTVKAIMRLTQHFSLSCGKELGVTQVMLTAGGLILQRNLGCTQILVTADFPPKSTIFVWVLSAALPRLLRFITRTKSKRVNMLSVLKWWKLGWEQNLIDHSTEWQDKKI